MKANFTEVARLWPSKSDAKSIMNGYVTTAMNAGLIPGQRLLLQKIDYNGNRPEKAPTHRVVAVFDFEVEDGARDANAAPDFDPTA